jgi:hypothetical protein
MKELVPALAAGGGPGKNRIHMHFQKHLTKSVLLL